MRNAVQTRRLTVMQIFAAPLALAGLLLFALVASLFGDGLWDTLASLAIAVVLGVTGLCILRSRRRLS